MWDWLFTLIDPLERAHIPYALVGSVAASVYGEPRATNDVDLVIQIRPDEAARLAGAYPADLFYVPPVEVIATELARPRDGHVNIIALETMAKADLYPVPAGESAWFERRRALKVADRTLWLAAPEVVILYKLIFFRGGGGEKHLRDIRGMLAVAGLSLDRPWLETEIARLALTAEWGRAGG